jgi:uncharacterized membrane protein YbhN (UPF0104 family)
MEKEPINLNKYIWGLVTSFIAVLAGVWLMLIAYTLSLQSYTSVWSQRAQVAFWTGLGVAIISLISLAAFTASIFSELRHEGMNPRRDMLARPTQAPEVGLWVEPQEHEVECA